MNPEARYAPERTYYTSSHSYDEAGEVQLRDDDAEDAKVHTRAAVYRFTGYPLPDPPINTTMAKVTDRLHLMAKALYNDPGKWWVIADANPQIRHPLDLKAGDVVHLPT